MSGIGGVLRFDGAPVARRGLERMANALRMHGPDRAEVMLAPPIGLVHVLMRMTPEDRFDRQPLRGPSGAIITADLRLDNRDDVLTRIGIPPQDALAWPDSRVVLAGWEKLADALWPTLHGPFAVAIWDPRSRTLTLARDQLGLNVAMWHRGEQFFAFATMPKGLFALAEVPREPNLEKMADFLVLNHAEHETTFYRDIFRLPPGHFMQVKPDGSVAQRRYWSPADLEPVRLASDQAYAEGLREVLDKAVRRQMRSAHPIGCFLSGGLDSSSVAALAAHTLAERGDRLAAFTQVPREGFNGVAPTGRYNDETPYVEAIRAMAGNIDVNYVHNNECDDFADLERLFLALEAPVRNTSNLGWMTAIPRLARAQGRRVLLSGQMGNMTISWFGWSQVIEHLLDGRLITVFRQGRQFYRHSPYSRWTAFRKLLLEPLAPERLAVWSDRRRRPHRIAPWQDHSPIRPEFAAEMGIEARASKVGHDFLYRMRRGERATGLTLIDHIGDWQAAEKAVHGVEVRDPTADLEVVAYCFGVPPEQYLAEDIDRSLIRRAMWGLLPETVLTNRLMGYQAADWYEKLQARRGEIAAQIAAVSSSPLVSRAIDVARLRRALERWPTAGWHTRKIIEEYQLALPRGIAGARFLRWIEQTNVAGAAQQAAANE
ncbi:MAG TPA: asparagine synthetase B [Xanthobacteraceae bacterium]|jgi:asparagine synthase (glutamine-hydrolysing)